MFSYKKKEMHLRMPLQGNAAIKTNKTNTISKPNGLDDKDQS